MSYPPQCYMYNCQQQCCNYYGSCPQSYYSTSHLSQCYYYYKKQLTGGEIAGAAVGGVIGFVIIVIIIVCCIKHCRDRNQKMQEAIATQNNVANRGWNTSTQNIMYNPKPPPLYNQQFAQPYQQVAAPIHQPYNQNGPYGQNFYGNPPYLNVNGPIFK